MISREEHLNVTSEINALQQLIESIPEERVLDRSSLERRLNALKVEAERIQVVSLARRLRMTFRGRPIVGSDGMYADFASEATGRLIEAVRAVVAGMKGDLKFMGPIPGAVNSNLLITAIAKGSFGFEFEAPRHEVPAKSPLFDGMNETEEAIEMIRRLLDVAASENDDDELAELVDHVHPRAVRKVREFLDVLSERGALCAMEFNGRSFRFTDNEQLDLGRRRLDDTNIRESEQTFDGEIQGVLPKSRTFEFKLLASDEKLSDQVIRAKIGFEIGDPDILNREYLHKRAVVRLHVTQVGQGRPRYVLHELPELYAN